MEDKKHIFLTNEHVVKAICNDFRQYEPQVLLFCEVMRLLPGGESGVKMELHKKGAWVSAPDSRNLRWMEGSELAEHLCTTLAAIDFEPELLAAIASRVFQTRVVPDVDPKTGQPGLSIETGIEGYSCRQCGHCCLSLDYRDEIRVEDVERWQALGRTDILEWVGVFKGEGQKTVYQIWIQPGTREVAEKCPFLQKDAATNRWLCRIHDVKPAICRQYPVSRKHALMTGCPGFDDPRSEKDN
jgi:Fe-S-cluster containining protein